MRESARIPGTRLAPWHEFFTALRRAGDDGCVMIESFDPSIESAKLCSIWRRLADSPEQLAMEGLRFLKGVHQQCAAA